MATKLPEFPKEASLASLKKIKVKEPKFTADGEWKVSFDGSKTLLKSVNELNSVFGSIPLKAFTELESAIKSGEDVIAKYQALGNEFPKIDNYKKLAESFSKAATKKAKTFTGDSKYDKLGKWYSSIGTKVKSHAETVEQLGDALLEKAEGVDTAKVTDLKWDLNTWDLTHTLQKMLGASYKHLEFDGKYQVDVSVTGKVGAEAAQNATLRAEFFEAAFDEGKKLAKTLHQNLTKIDNGLDKGKLKTDAATKAVDAAYKSFDTAYKKAADKAIQDKWNEFCKDKKDYKKYKIKTGFKIVGKTVGLGVGLAATITTGWTGVGTVMGGAAALKGAAELGTACYDAWLSAQKLKGQIDTELETLKERFKSAGLASTKEVGGATLEALTGIRTTTVKSVGGKVKLFADKLKGCHTHAVNMGKKIDTVLKETSGLKRKVSKGLTDFSSSKKAVKAFKKLENKVKDFEKATGKLLDKASSAASDYREGKGAIGEYVATINELNGEIHGAAKFLIKWGTPVLKFAFVSDGASAITAAGSVARDFITIGTQTTDELEEANQVGDLLGDVTGLVTGLLG